MDAKSEEPQSFVFQSEDALSNQQKLMVLIHGSGVVRAGQWARRLNTTFEGLRIMVVYANYPEQKLKIHCIFHYTPHLSDTCIWTISPPTQFGATPPWFSTLDL